MLHTTLLASVLILFLPFVSYQQTPMDSSEIETNISEFTKRIRKGEFEYLQARATMYYLKGDTNDALADIENYFKSKDWKTTTVNYIDSQSAILYLEMIRGMETTPKISYAIDIIQKLFENNISVMSNLAYTQLTLGNYDESIKIYNSLIKEEGQKENWIYNRAICLNKLKKHRKARLDSFELIKMNASNSDYHYLAGISNIGLDDLASAKEEFYKALKIDSCHEKSINKLIDIFESNSDSTALKNIIRQKGNCEESK